MLERENDDEMGLSLAVLRTGPWIGLTSGGPSFRCSSWSAAWLVLKLKSSGGRKKNKTKHCYLLSDSHVIFVHALRVDGIACVLAVNCRFPGLQWNKSTSMILKPSFHPIDLLFFPSRNTVPLSPISQHSLIFSPSLTYSQPLPPSALFTPAALLSVPPSQATCYSVQGGCRQHYSSSAYCCCRTTLFHPPSLPPPLHLSVW